MSDYHQTKRTGKAPKPTEMSLPDIAKQRELRGKGVKGRVRAYIKEIQNGWDYHGIWQNFLIVDTEGNEEVVRMRAYDVPNMITSLYATRDWWWWEIRWCRYNDEIWFEAVRTDRISCF